MAVTSSTSRITYTGNASTVTAYPVPFVFTASSDLVVVRKVTATGVETTLTETTDYVVTGGAGSTGSLVTTSAVAATSTVTIYREVPATQSLSYEEADDFPAKSHEGALDRLTFLAQQNARKLAASLRVRESDGDLTPVSLIVNGILGTNASGQAVMLTGAQVQTLLNLPSTVVDQPTKTFADAAARGTATPDFLGQVGVQLDTSTVYIGTSIAAGGWTAYDFSISAGSIGTANLVDSAVTAAKLASDAVTTAKILDANVTTAKLATSAVTGAKLTAGMVVQVVTASSTTRTTSTTVIPRDDTIPTNTEGVQILSAAITPQATSETVLVRAVCQFEASAGRTVAMAVFRGSTCIAVGSVFCDGANINYTCAVEVLDSPASTSAQTYTVRFGPDAGTAYTLGGASRLYGGAMANTITLQGIKG